MFRTIATISEWTWTAVNRGLQTGFMFTSDRAEARPNRNVTSPDIDPAANLTSSSTSLPLKHKLGHFSLLEGQRPLKWQLRLQSHCKVQPPPRDCNRRQSKGRCSLFAGRGLAHGPLAWLLLLRFQPCNGAMTFGIGPKVQCGPPSAAATKEDI